MKRERPAALTARGGPKDGGGKRVSMGHDGGQQVVVDLVHVVPVGARGRKGKATFVNVVPDHEEVVSG